MASTVLTDVAVRNLKPSAGLQVDVYDSRIRGLAVRVSPMGTKAFVVWYRIGGKARRLTLGRFPTMSLGEARKRAQEALLQVADGKDPAAEKQWARAEYGGNLFTTLVDQFIETYAKRKTRGWGETERLLKREFVSLWGTWPIETISRQDVTKVLNGVVKRGAPSAANNALAALRKMFNWAIEHGHVDRSPCLGIKAPSKLKSRDRVLTEQELICIWQAAEEMGYPYGRIIQLLILTAQRRNEITGMRWVELDVANRKWTIPAERTKPGRTHELPLSQAAIKLLQSLPKVHDDLVFPARGKDNPASGFSKWKHQLDALAGMSDWRVHDLRRTVASGMARLKVPPHIIEKILNHTTGTLGGVAGIYNRFGYLSEMKDALDQWANHVVRLVATEVSHDVSRKNLQDIAFSRKH
jgi:integrase